MPCIYLCDPFLTLQKTFQITSEQKHTRQIWICPAKYSCTKISGPSEVPWFVGDFIVTGARGWGGARAGRTGKSEEEM